MYIGKLESAYSAFGVKENSAKKARQQEQEERKMDAFVSSGDSPSFAEKLAIAEEYTKMMENLKTTDPEKYTELMKEQELAEVRSLDRLTEVAEKYGGDITFRGVNLQFISDKKMMCLGDMNHGDVINAGVMSNGYCFYFNRGNIGELSKIIDLFSPEDVNKIMAAIATDEHIDKIKNEMEEEEANGVKGANE